MTELQVVKSSMATSESLYFSANVVGTVTSRSITSMQLTQKREGISFADYYAKISLTVGNIGVKSRLVTTLLGFLFHGWRYYG